MSESKFWCFTLNNWTMEEYKQLKKMECEYIVIGKEIGKKGTPHLQGYVEFKSNHKFKRLKKINRRIRWATRKGTALQASDYCKKDGKFREIGSLSNPEPGKRNDIVKIREMVQNGDRMVDIIMECSNPQTVRMAELLMKYKEPCRDWLCDVYWYTGPTGSGKTRAAFAAAEKDDGVNGRWVSGKNLRWWEGYDGHPNIIIDDFRSSFCNFEELIRLLDSTEYRVEVKGSSRQIRARKIWITSIYPPDQVYKNLPPGEDIDQLLRRITKIKTFKCKD